MPKCISRGLVDFVGFIENYQRTGRQPVSSSGSVSGCGVTAGRGRLGQEIGLTHTEVRRSEAVRSRGCSKGGAFSRNRLVGATPASGSGTGLSNRVCGAGELPIAGAVRE